MQKEIPTHLYEFSTDPSGLADLYADQQKLQQRQALAQALMNTTYIPNSGAAGLLAGAASMIRGRMMQNEDEGKVSDWFRRYFDQQNKSAAAQRQRQIEDEQRKMQQEIFKDTTVARSKAQSEAQAKRDYPEVKYDSSSGGFVDPMNMKFTPNQEAQNFMLQKAHAGRSVTSINMANENAFQKALGEKDAGEFVKWRDRAIAANNTLKQADVIEQILSNTQTGKVPEALAMAGQYFGTQAGADLQSLKGAIQPAVLERVKQLGTGSGISNADREFIEKGMPGFGNDPRANARLLNIMRTASKFDIDEYQRAQDYVNKNRTLAGYVPSAPTRPAEATSASQAMKAPKDMTDAEIRAALGLIK